METVSRYCIEIIANKYDTETHSISIQREDIPSICFYHDDMAFACYAFSIYEAYCNQNYYHVEFRPIYGNYQWIICEKYSDMTNHLCYESYIEFKQFIETIGYNPFTKEFINK